MGLIVLRCVFVMVAVGLSVSFINNPNLVPADSEWMSYAVIGGMLAGALGVIALDVAIRRKELATITAVYFGLLVGLFLTYVFDLVLQPLQLPPVLLTVLRAVLGAILCYVCISVLMQTKDDFRFIIPYVEFAREVKGLKPWILDTSAVIDGRIADVLETGVFDGQLVMPRFVMIELQGIADSGDRLRRARGRRGLDVLNRLRGNARIDLVIHEPEPSDAAGQPVDLKLVALARQLKGKLLTNDYNLNKVARLQGVEVVNLNDLANALKPVFLPGERIEVRLVKPGEEAGQGVGYLEDGTMVVVEGGREHLNQTVALAVTSVLQTSAGRMVFGRVEAGSR